MRNIFSDLKLIIFDMDGVLVNSMGHHVKAWYHAFHKYRYPVKRSELKALAGVPARETVEIFSSQKKIPFGESTARQIIQTKSEMKRDLGPDQPFPFTKKILAHLLKKNLTLALVTGSKKSNAQHIIGKYFPNTFKTLVCPEDSIKGKPHPEPFIKALSDINARLENEKRHISANQCLVIEDGIPGLQGARKAGMRTIGLATTVGENELKEYADLVIKNHRELFTWLKLI
jgi:HAD superfamily hydrolase (TIGR01509 family)